MPAHTGRRQNQISIHALLAESDNGSKRQTYHRYEFLSTLSLRRATRRYSACCVVLLYFYPRSPCGERPPPYKLMIHQKNFYPRSPCGERPRRLIHHLSTYQFLSTLSLRRATCYSLRHSAQGWHFYPRSPCGERLWPGLLARPFFIISIHALLAESDPWGAAPPAPPRHFYPRSPCGERLRHAVNLKPKTGFLSTLSLRRATRYRINAK